MRSPATIVMGNPAGQSQPPAPAQQLPNRISASSRSFSPRLELFHQRLHALPADARVPFPRIITVTVFSHLEKACGSGHAQFFHQGAQTVRADLFKRHRRHNQSAANIHVNLGHGLVVNNAKRQRTQSLILRPNGHRLAVVFRLKAILECGDMSPLFNETTRRRAHQC